MLWQSNTNKIQRVIFKVFLCIHMRSVRPRSWWTGNVFSDSIKFCSCVSRCVLFGHHSFWIASLSIDAWVSVKLNLWTFCCSKHPGCEWVVQQIYGSLVDATMQPTSILFGALQLVGRVISNREMQKTAKVCDETSDRLYIAELTTSTFWGVWNLVADEQLNHSFVFSFNCI